MRSAVAHYVLAACALFAAGCPRALSDSYTCTSSSQCVFGGKSGVCEPTGACSFADASCESGRRYGDLGPPPLAGACVVVDTDLGTVVWPPDLAAPDLSTPGHPPIVRVGATKVPPAAPQGGAAVVIALPTGVAPGDLLVATVYVNDSASNVSAPSGWVLQDDIAVASKFRAVWFYKPYSAADPSPTAFAVSNSPPSVAAAIVAYRYVDTTKPIDVAMSKQFVGGSYTTPSLTTTKSNDMLVAMFIDNAQGFALSVPAGMSSAVEDTAIFVYDQLQAAAGATGTKTASNLPGVGAINFVALAPMP